MLEQILEVLSTAPGLVAHLGIEVDARDSDAIVCRMRIDERHQGKPGVAHGGAITAFLDTTLGLSALAYGVSHGKAVSTVELKVNFLRPVPIGTAVVGRAELQSAGRSLIVVSGTAIDDATEEKLGFAVGTFNLYGAR